MTPADHLPRYRFKLADTAEERDAINRLLYRAFVLEVPRYTAPPHTEHLVDKFDHKNRYIIAQRDGRICGVLAAHDRPPFSVAGALAEPEILDRFRPGPLEVRMLTVEPDERRGQVLGGLLWSAFDYARAGGYRYVVISGLADRQAMYRRMGFRPLGPAVRRGLADFIPMLFDFGNVPDRVRRNLDRLKKKFQEPIETA